jgi:hypothetical protein
MLMELTRHQFFASPTLALNEHGEIGGRDSFDTGAEGLHLVTGPNQHRTRLGRLTLRRLLAVPCGFDHNSPHGCKKSELARDARMERLTIERRHLEHGAPARVGQWDIECDGPHTVSGAARLGWRSQWDLFERHTVQAKARLHGMLEFGDRVIGGIAA